MAGTCGGLDMHLRSLRGSFARIRRRTAACGKTPASSTSCTAWTHSAVALSVMKKSMLLAELVGLPVCETTPCTMSNHPEDAKVSGVMLASQATIHLPFKTEIAAASSSRMVLFSGLSPSPCRRYRLMTVQPPRAVVWVKTVLWGSEGVSSAFMCSSPKHFFASTAAPPLREPCLPNLAEFISIFQWFWAAPLRRLRSSQCSALVSCSARTSAAVFAR